MAIAGDPMVDEEDAVNSASVLAYISAALVGLWGVSHAIPTRAVVAGFGPISRDNRLYIIQEWIAEAFTMWFIAALLVVTTAIAGEAPVTAWVYRVAAAMLIGVAALTAATGARTEVIWFKICPFLLGSTAILLVVASVL